MQLTFTDAAVEELRKRQADKNLSLFYASDPLDCGCPNTGIFMLRVHDDPKEYDATLNTNLGEIRTSKMAMVYLDEDNKLDYNKSQGTFQLKSERGFLAMNLKVEKNKANV